MRIIKNYRSKTLRRSRGQAMTEYLIATLLFSISLFIAAVIGFEFNDGGSTQQIPGLIEAVEGYEKRSIKTLAVPLDGSD